MAIGYEGAYWSGDGGRRWASLADSLDRHHAAVTDLVVERAAPRAGERVLDIGAGQGTLARRLAASGAAVTGIDISPQLLGLARREPGPTFLEADAATHDFAPLRFDLIASQFGVMFFEDSRAAFAHLRRQAAAGGRLVFAAWGPAEENPWFALPRSVAVRIIGDKESDPDAPGPMRFRDIGAVEGMLAAAGWREAGGEAVTLDLTPPGGLAGAADLATRMGAASAILTHHGAGEAQRLELREALAVELARFERDGDMAVPARVNLFEARA
jgi:SAM-dependent methyltransferase